MDKFSLAQTIIGGIDCKKKKIQVNKKTNTINDVKGKFKMRHFKNIKSAHATLLHTQIAIFGTHFFVASDTMILGQG